MKSFLVLVSVLVATSSVALAKWDPVRPPKPNAVTSFCGTFENCDDDLH